MKLTVYLDILLLINTIVNYYLLKITMSALKLTADLKRLLVSSFTGALFSCAVLVEMNNIYAFFLRIISVIVCAYLAFGFINTRSFIKNTFALIGTNLLYTGFIYNFLGESSFTYINNYFCYIHINPVLFVSLVCVIYFVMWAKELVLAGKHKDYIYEFTIWFDGRSKQFKSFYDTGFNIKDIIGGKAVMLCAAEDLNEVLLPGEISAIYSFLKGEMDKGVYTPVFYSDITGQGMLPCIKPDKVIYKNKEIKNTVIAVTDKKFDRDVRIIFGKEVFNLTGD